MKHGHVYFLAYLGDKAIKVGWSGNHESRIAQLRSSSIRETQLLGIVPGTRKHERAMHDALAEFRSKGEWFADVEPVRSLISEVLNHGCISFDGKLRDARNPPGSPNDWSQRAQLLANLIVSHSNIPRSRLNAIERQYNVPAGSLWKMLYRPPEDLGVGTYVALIKGAYAALADARRSLESQLSLVEALDLEFSSGGEAPADAAVAAAEAVVVPDEGQI